MIRDNTGVTRDARGNPTVGANLGNIAETFEFRAIDRDLKTPLCPAVEPRRAVRADEEPALRSALRRHAGREALQALAFNQGFDLNDPSTPDHIFERFNQAYVAAGSPNGPLNAGATARERGFGSRLWICQSVPRRPAPPARAACSSGVAGAPLDLNLANAITCSGSTLGGGQVINFEARVPVLGFNVPEALLLQSNGDSIYHGAQFSLTKRLLATASVQRRLHVVEVDRHQLDRPGQHGGLGQARCAEHGLRGAGRPA